MTPLVLVENEVTVGGRYDHWQDVTGERYQFPNQYRNKIKTGRQFVYYRGVRRSEGKRGSAEYFGTGVIGTVYLDPENDEACPKARRKWLCEIDDYQPFRSPVSAKIGDEYLEQIPGNFWSVAVRDLQEDVFARILALAGVPAQPESSPELPPLADVLAEAGDELLLPRGLPRDDSLTYAGSQRSKYGLALKRRGEEIVLAHLRGVLTREEAETLRWPSGEGEKASWDIEYRSGDLRVAVEVRATAGPVFPSLELRANEWNAAKLLGDAYLLALVTRAKSTSPRVQLLRDPARLVDALELRIEPTAWRLELAQGSRSRN